MRFEFGAIKIAKLSPISVAQISPEKILLQ